MMTSDEDGGPVMRVSKTPTERVQRVAVFVDVENVLGWLKRGGCTELLAKARELGVVSIRRAFGDFSNPTVASRQVELQRHGFDLVHTLHPAKGKSNSADISMTIDVMESCRGPDIQWVMLATGDSDFGPVFRRLRELGKGVVGVGPSSVLSSSVALSCHEFIFTDDDNGRSGSVKKGRGKGSRGERTGSASAAGATATWAGIGGRSSALRGARVATPPQLLSARGGFRLKQQPATAGEGTVAGAAAARVGSAAQMGEAKVSTSPLLLGGPAPAAAATAAAAAATAATFGRRKRPTIDWVASPLPSTPPPLPRPPPASPPQKSDLSAAFARASLEDEAPSTPEPFLSPGQLLLPGMVKASAAASSPTTTAGSGSGLGAIETNITGESLGAQGSPTQPIGGVFAGSGGFAGGGPVGGGKLFGTQDSSPHASGRDHASNNSVGQGVDGDTYRARARSVTLPPPSIPPAFGGLGALSAIRPSEKLYRHLLSVGPTSSEPAAASHAGGPGAARGCRTGSLASDWGDGLSEVTVAKGLVSLAEACGGQGGEPSRAAEALGGFYSVGTGGVAGAGLERDEAFRVASLLQRCGFLSWVAKEQQWLVTVPADPEVLRRRRDEAMMEELLIRCQEAGVPFEPKLAANLLWSKAR